MILSILLIASALIAVRLLEKGNGHSQQPDTPAYFPIVGSYRAQNTYERIKLLGVRLTIEIGPLHAEGRDAVTEIIEARRPSCDIYQA